MAYRSSAEETLHILEEGRLEVLEEGHKIFYEKSIGIDVEEEEKNMFGMLAYIKAIIRRYTAIVAEEKALKVKENELMRAADMESVYWHWLKFTPQICEIDCRSSAEETVRIFEEGKQKLIKQEREIFHLMEVGFDLKEDEKCLLDTLAYVNTMINRFTEIAAEENALKAKENELMGYADMGSACSNWSKFTPQMC
jgi:hypothetical protein